MTATAAKWGFGTTLTRDDKLIAQITDIGGIDITQESIDATNYDSADAYKEKIFGLLDAGTLTIEGDFKPDDTDGQIGLKTDMEAHTVQTFVLTLPSAFATTLTFTAGVTRFAIKPPRAGKVTFSATLDISGKPTLATTTSNKITALTVTTATAFPTFDEDVHSYVLGTAGTSVLFKATFAAGTCVLKEDGVLTQTLTSTEDSAAVTASTTPKTVRLEVTQTGKTMMAYVFLLTKTS